MAGNGLEIILTTDRSMMTTHHGKEFLGFMATGPAIGMPEKLWMWIACPKMKTDSAGRPWQAPYALRKLEALLQDHGYDAAVIDPDHVNRYLAGAKVLMLSHHDYFALCPPSSEWWVVTKKEPVNAKSFKSFMESLNLAEAKKRGLKIIVGGPAAWQWLYKPDLIEEWGIDTIVDGEGERVVLDLLERIYAGEPLPRYIFVGPSDVPSIEEIPLIKMPSINGLIEIMRGCPRGCRFCSVTLRPLRHIPLDRIEKEMLVNLEGGVNSGILHSEDVLLYGARGLKLNPDALIKLHHLARKHWKSIAWSHASLAAIKNAEEEHHLISKIMEIVRSNGQEYLGVEVGIETGSVRLAKKIMPAKSAPYPPEKWPEIVEDAFAIMHENNIVPAATLILLAIGDAGKISATTLRDTLKISTGSLYYNLRQLRRFVTQDGDKNYMLTEEGLRVYRALKEKGTITAADLMEQNQRSRVFSMFKSAFFPLWLYTPLYEQKTVFMILPALSAILSVALLIYTRQAPLMLHFYRVEPNVFRIAGQYLLNISILYILSTVLSIIFSGALFRGGEEGLMARIRSIAWHSIWDEVKFVGALAVAQLPLMLYPAILSVNKLFSLSIIPAERTAQYYLVTGTLSTISQVLALPLLTGLIAYGRRLDGATAALAALIIFFTSHVVFQAVTFASVV